MDKNKNLISILKEGDYQKFKSLMLSSGAGSISEHDEVEFFKIAPEAWKKRYVNTIWPQPASERCMMISGSMEVLQLSYSMWGFWQENVLWVFENGSVAACLRVLRCLTSNPGEDVEIAMLHRNDVDLLRSWLEKFHSLREEGERLLAESVGLQSLKSAYIDYTLEKESKRGSD